MLRNVLRPNAVGPSVARPNAVGPSIAGPSVAGPSVAGPSVAGPSIAGPIIAPNKVFIVPYRNREAHKAKFLAQMSYLLADELPNTYKIMFVHQMDERPFNRGAMKNIGFLCMRKMYPQQYQAMTFVFNDIDTYPATKGLVPYDTVPGTVQHYFGYKFALGGFFAIKGGDFEKSGGFPNFWGWGLEDNALQERCVAAGLTIDRSCFFPIGCKEIVQEFDGYNRVLSKRDSVVYKFETPDNMLALKDVRWQINDNFINKLD